MVKRYFLLGLIPIFLIFLFMVKNNQDNEANQKNNRVCFNEHCFFVETAKTPQEISRGLMFRESLEFDRGMLFIFEKEDEHSFWMKNTLIALDIIWLDSGKKAVYIKKDAQPCGQGDCPSIKPNKKAKYVLEINSGSTDKIGLKLGDKFIFEID